MTNLLLAPPPLGTVLSLTGLPGGSNKAYGRSPYGNTGTIVGATWARLPSGLWVLSFDGQDDYIDLNSKTLTGQGARTVGVWFKRESGISANEALLGEQGSSAWERGFIAHMQADGTVRTQISKGDGTRLVNITDTPLAYDDGAWHQYAFTWNGTTDADKAIVYIDGVSVVTATATGTTQGGDSNDNTTLGAIDGGATWFLNGSIGEVWIYNRALSYLEIQRKYLATEWRYR